jgi:hypothetical protein
MRIDDFICLGRTVPEESKKYGAKVCMAGVSLELGSLMRVYPLPVQNPIRVRHECILELQRNHQDSRKESWKLKNRGESIATVSDKPIVETEGMRAILEPFRASSIRELNQKRWSLGVLELKELRGYFRERTATPHPDQGMLFEIADECFGADAIDLAPCIEFWDEEGLHHDLQIREWGCYEWLRKERPKASQLWANLGFMAGKRVWAVVGNQANRRTSWLIIKTFLVSSATQRTMFGDYQADILDSPQWKARRKVELDRAGHRCQACNASGDDIVLDVHHRTYDRVGNEGPADLIVLCRKCHGAIHANGGLAR